MKIGYRKALGTAGPAESETSSLWIRRGGPCSPETYSPVSHAHCKAVIRRAACKYPGSSRARYTLHVSRDALDDHGRHHLGAVWGPYKNELSFLSTRVVYSTRVRANRPNSAFEFSGRTYEVPINGSFGVRSAMDRTSSLSRSEVDDTAVPVVEARPRARLRPSMPGVGYSQVAPCFRQ